ncbi:MAG TPA: zf-HC2 domain-containing protein [Gemmatimonadales bacterium]|nr:zf-HC2 domain-containing protein [Gemmatimonadales bacterium]
MSHADEGTLHAYLDGALAPPEVRGVEAHLADCPTCRDRLAEERGLRARAAELLGVALPPERALPAFPARDRAARVPRWWRVRGPLAWAATVILALGIGIYLGSSSLGRSGSQIARLEPPGVAVPEGRDLNRVPEVAEHRPEAALAPAPSRPSSARAVAKTGVGVSGAGRHAEPPANTLRESTSGAPERELAAPAAALAPAPPAAAREEQASRGLSHGADSLATIALPGAFSLDSARVLLGRDPVALPGVPIRAVRRVQRPGYTAAVVIEQQLDSGTVLQLVEGRRAEMRLGAMEPRARLDSGVAAERAPALQRGVVPAAPAPARLVDELEVTMTSPPLSLDSLTRLLQRLKAVRP